MSMSTSEQIAQMVVKRLVLAWDSDFTKVTPAEAAAIQAGQESLERGEHTPHEDINWN